MARLPRVVALISAYNEADIIGSVLSHLAEQGVDAYLIDDGSTDDTVRVASAFLGRGLREIERRVPPGAAAAFSWREILRRKEALSTTLDADWFIHHDADEFRESPWPGLTLQEAIARVDRAGFTAIDFRLLNFRPTDADDSSIADVRERQQHYEEAATWDRWQVKCWKRTAHPVDLASSGGHTLMFPDRAIYPVRFLLRHYPFRTPAQAARRVFVERVPRFTTEERDRGWHVQYDAFDAHASFEWRARDLTSYDDAAVKASLLEVRHWDDPVRGLVRYADRLEAKLSQLGAELEHERRMRNEDARAFDRLSAEHAQVVERLAAMYASRSWRVTKPLRSAYSRLAGVPEVSEATADPGAAAAGVQWGDLARHTPISTHWGVDRGTPVDRYYIHAFLRAHASDIRGAVLEVKDAGYTRMFGGDAVAQSDVIDVDTANPNATLVADLSVPAQLPQSRYQCFICTQTLHIIANLGAAVEGASRLLAPGGILLCSIPAVSRVNDENGGLETGDYWRLTAAAVAYVFREHFDAQHVEIRTFGNVRACAAFLYGLAAEELPRETLDFNDPWFPLVHCIRAVKR